MKKYFIFSFIVLLFTTVSCSDWTETETKNIDKLLAGADSAQAKAYRAYLENLRAYKKTDHQVRLHVAFTIFLTVQTSYHFGMVSQT